MKKILFLLIMLAAMVPWATKAQQTITIGTGTGTTYYTPFNSLWGYSFVEAIYTSAEISAAGGLPGTITSISYTKSSGTGQTNNVVVYMKNVSRTSFSSNTDWEPVTAADIVYQGTFTIPTTGTATITLDVPFSYDGTNLMVAMHEYTSGYTTQYFVSSTTSSSTVISAHSDSSDPDPYNLSSFSGTQYTQTTRADIQIELTAGNITCHSTGTLNVSNITPTDAQITWGLPEDGGSYILQYKPATSTWESSDVTTDYPYDTTYTFNGLLTPMTAYDVRVANLCGAGDTSFWRNTSFTTACTDVTTLPLTENFDTYGTGETAYPNCWSKINTYSSNRPYCNSSNTYPGGVASLYFYTNTSGTYNIAIMPQFDASIPVSGLQADFMYRANSTNDRLIVGVMTDNTDASTFVPVDTIQPGTSPTTWEERTVVFNNYTGTGQYIAFRNNYISNGAYAYIDNLVVDVISNCPKPTDLAISNITAEGCDLAWESHGQESTWEVVAVPAGTDVNSGTPETAYSNPHTITGLLDNTQYDVYVRANCGSEYSAWSFKKTFTTNPLCTSPLNVSVSQVAATSAMITWNSAIYGATGYTVAYSEAGQGNWTLESVTGNEYLISGLEPNTAYDVYVKSECDLGHADSVVVHFTTNCLSGGDPFTDGDISSYYIPVNNYYNYTYSQQIYLASEMGGAATIDSIAFEYGYSSSSTVKTNVTIYLGHTTQSTFSGTSNYIPSTNLQQVYTGNLNCSQGWNTFVFSTPFQYNGTDNLVLVVDDNSGDYDGSSYVFRAHDAGATRTVYYYSDSNNPNPANPTSGSPNSATSANRSNVKFFIPCDNTVTCIAPNVYVNNVTESSITLDWAPGYTESSWEVEYSTDANNWTPEGTVSTHPYTIDNLDANTLYYIRIRSICSGGEYSDWRTVSERTACNDLTTLPFMENFDSYTGTTSTSVAINNLPYCWNYLNECSSASYSGYPIIYSSTASAASGSNAMRFYTTTGTSYDDQIAILPSIDVNVYPINTLQLAIDARAMNTSYTFRLDVGIMTDPSDRNTFVTMQTLNLTSTTYTNYEIPFNQYTGTGKYIALRASQPTTGYNYGYVDNIRVELIPACPRPHDVTSTATTANSVTLGWTEPGTATSWVITYGPSGFTPGSSVGTSETVYDNPYTVTGLSGSTSYDFYVQSDCGDSYSNFSNVYSVSTECDVITALPFMENFDACTGATSTSVSVNNLPYCWSNLNTGTNTSYTGYPIIYSSTTYAASGNNAVRFYTYTTSTYGDQTAILPEIDVNTFPMNTLQIAFDARQNSTSYTFNLVVGIMTDPAVASTFVPVQTVAVTSTSYTTFEVPFTQYTGTGSYIAIKAPQPTSGYNYGYIDNIVVEIAPLCSKPTNVQASNITASGADINWIPGGDETGWEVVVVPAGASVTTGTAEQVSAHPFTLTGLNDNTAYDVYVRADCGTGTDFSSWSQKCSFTTTPLCSAPTNVTVSQVAGTSALVTWTPAVFGATAYTIAYTETGMNSWTSLSVTGDNYMITGLTPETPYTLTITSECDEGTAPAVTKTFTTGCLAGGDYHIGDGTGTTSYFPEYCLYNYSYTQQIFLASELEGPTTISSIAFDATDIENANRNLQIYLMHTSATSSSSWLDASTAQQVYSGTYSLTTGWNTFNFSTPFQYNGTDNLAVIVLDMTGSWSGTNTFHSHTTSGNLSRYVYEDDDAYSITSVPSSGTSTNTRNNVIFGFPCDNTVTCIAPNVYVSNATENSLTLNWAPGDAETSWELEISSEIDTTWVSQGTVSNPPYTISNLSSNTLYYVRMRSICGGGNFSNWTTANHRTECAPIASVPFMENFDSYAGSTSTTVSVNNLPYCWSYLNEGTNTSYSGYPMIYASATFAQSGTNALRFYTYTTSGTYDDQIAILPEIDVNTLPLNTLQLSFDARNISTYTFTLVVGVMTDPTDKATFMPVSTITTTSNTYANYEIPFNQYTGTGTYIAIKAPKPTSSYNAGYVDNVVVEPIPSCPKPTQVHAVSLTNNSIELGWTENGSATSWVIEYGPAGFTPGNGTEVNASTNPYTISNLTSATTYSFYVKADCGGGDMSNYSPVFSTATACDAIDQLPLTDNFDTYSTGESAYPDCWSKINTYSSNRPYCNSSNTYPGGVASLYFYAASATYNIAITPPFDVTIPINTLQATFMYRAYNSTDYMIVGVMTNPADATTFVPVDTVYPNSTASTWVEKEVIFNNYTGNGQYIAFYNGKATTTCYSYIDNLVIDLIPTCPKPHDVTVTGVTSSSATLSWTAVGSETSWEIAYGAAGFDPDGNDATIVTANTNPFEVQNLSAATSYEFYVRALCSATDLSPWTAQAASATTECAGALTLPYSEDFEGYAGTTYSTPGVAPACWTTYSTNTTYGAPHITSSGSYHYVHSGTNCLVFTCGSAGADAYAALPEFNQPLNTLHLNFWRAMESTSSGTLTVGYVTNLADMASSFVSVATIPSVYQQSSGDTISVDFTTASIPANGYICFHWNYSSSFYSCCIDDINVTASGSGPVITNPTVATNTATAIGQTTATLNATITNPDNVTITAKGFEWKATTGGTYTQVTGTGTGNSFTADLSNLNPSTNYTYKAFITYNGTTTYGTEMNFTTLPQGVDPCNVPTGLHTTNIENHAITIAWDADANVESWNIQYRVANSGALSSATSTTNSYTITNLEGNTDYEIQVQANCGNGNLSDWSSSITAHTTNVGIENFTENNVTLFPNPAKEYVDIRIDGDVNVTNMEVFDVYGKLINTVNVIDNPTRINVNGLANGMYFVRVTTDKGAVTKTFVKK